MITITDILHGSPAARAGLKKGDQLIAVNHTVIHDVLDYRFASAESKLTVRFLRGNREMTCSLRKGQYDDPGMCFASPLMDEKQTCGNHCIFCFIDQNPKGLRSTLYFKDDDARLSFLQGSYITLTNLTDEDVERIIRMHLSVNVSVHTTEPELRAKMLGNKRGGTSLQYLSRMAKAGVPMNCQIVLCPGWNDGEHLHKTLADLFQMLPAVESIAVVPFGMTRYREHLCQIKSFTPESAREAVAQIEAVAAWSLQANGKRIVYASDELYLLGGLPLPEEEAYEGYPQYENGVGMLRSLISEFDEALELAEGPVPERHVSIATGTAAAPFLTEMMQKLHEKFPEIHCNVYTIQNQFFGETVTVAGLLTGQDLLTQLRGKPLGEAVYLTEACLRHDDVFLDDMSRSELENALGVPVIKVPTDGYQLLDAILGRS